MNVRLLCATHADIPKAIAAGKFRQDLYYRINTVQVVFAAIARAAALDIPLLAGHFLRRFAREMDRDVRDIAPVASRSTFNARMAGQRS